MKCWFCEKESVGVCIACGRGLCKDHVNIHDKMALAKSDTSTGHSTYYSALGTLKCSECKLEWETFEQGKKIVK